MHLNPISINRRRAGDVSCVAGLLKHLLRSPALLKWAHLSSILAQAKWSARELTFSWKVCTLFKHGAMEGNDLSCFLLNVQTVGFHRRCSCMVLLKAELIMMRSDCEQASLHRRNVVAVRRAVERAALFFLHVFTLLEHFRDKFWLLQQQQ